MAEDAKNIYFDQNFIDGMNEIENSRFSQIIQLVIESVSFEANHEKLTNVSKIFNSIFAAEKTPLAIYRKLKSLVHFCVYNRFSKKFKNDMLTLGLKQEKIDILCDLVKIDIDNLNDKLKNTELTAYLQDFEIKTEMPVSSTNYQVSSESKSTPNIDYKKQSLNINFTIHDGGNKELFFSLEKGQLVNFYEEIEKIQEKLDKLY